MIDPNLMPNKESECYLLRLQAGGEVPLLSGLGVLTKLSCLVVFEPTALLIEQHSTMRSQGTGNVSEVTKVAVTLRDQYIPARIIMEQLLDGTIASLGENYCVDALTQHLQIVEVPLLPNAA